MYSMEKETSIQPGMPRIELCEFLFTLRKPDEEYLAIWTVEHHKEENGTNSWCDINTEKVSFFMNNYHS